MYQSLTLRHRLCSASVIVAQGHLYDVSESATLNTNVEAVGIVD